MILDGSDSPVPAAASGGGLLLAAGATAREDFRRALDVIFWGSLHPRLGALPHMRAGPAGRIVKVTFLVLRGERAGATACPRHGEPRGPSETCRKSQRGRGTPSGRADRG